MRGLDLFSGIGGITFALRDWVKPVAYCEIDPYCQKVLLSLMAKQCVGKAPIWDDIRTLSGYTFPRESIDIIYGGFPCQDISIAGSGKGLDGERSGLVFEMLRLANEIKPEFIFLENVPAITTRGGLRIVKEIASLGYDCRWCVISAASVGALHKRDRWFLLAHTNSQGSSRLCSGEKKRQPKLRSNAEYKKWDNWPKDKPMLLGMVNGLPNRMDRIKALGNAVVPQQVRKAFELLLHGKDL